MKLKKEKFIPFLEKGFDTFKYPISKKEKKFVFKKAEELIELLNEMDNQYLLKKLDQREINKINKNFEASSKNIGEINKMMVSFLNMIKGKEGTEIILKDEQNNEYRISAHQIATFIGISYASLCEFNRIWFSQLVDLDKFKWKPTGIGSLIKVLGKMGLKTDFFNHIDSKVRNSFFHLDFKFEGMKVYCDNGTNKDYIGLVDLIKFANNTDRSGLVIMYVCKYFIYEYEKLIT